MSQRIKTEVVIQFGNIILIFPSISLLAENQEKILHNSLLKDCFIHTLSDEEFDLSQKNIWIFTPERYLSFIDNYKQIQFDFAFIDEIYKIDNSYIIDNESIGENERDIAYRIALQFISDTSTDILLAGPYMDLPQLSNTVIDKSNQSLNNVSIYNFIINNKFNLLQYNDYEIVQQDSYTIKTKKEYTIDKTIKINIGQINKSEKINHILNALNCAGENTIIYCGTKTQTEKYASKYIEKLSQKTHLNNNKNAADETYIKFIRHLSTHFDDDWIIIKALKYGIGIHHGLVPKYIQKEIIDLFNKNILKYLFATTTITEGVNTNAKNVLVTTCKKGTKPLRTFDTKNIAGRAGRFFEHYVGRVISIDAKFEVTLHEPQELLEHKNYDKQAPKKEVDYQITKDQYLNDQDLSNKRKIQELIQTNHIPLELIEAYKIIPPKSKIELYLKITNLTCAEWQSVEQLITTIHSTKGKGINWDGLQIVLNCVEPILEENENKLKILISLKCNQGTSIHSVIIPMLNSYLSGGYER